MTATIQSLLPLLGVLVVVAIVARRLNTAPSILLVIAGIGLALAPGLPRVELAPELVLLLILPPLIYSAGVAMSWREFRFNVRPITLLAFGCVVFTTCAVAAIAHWLLGMPLAVAFVLGAIVAPPDVVAPLAIAGRLGLPRRLMVVLEGEGLANDATALILYRFAVAAVSTGHFAFGQAAGTFALIVAGEIAYGIGIGWLSLRLRRWARDPRVEITLSLMTPYAAFWLPAHLGGSGVLAAIAAGLFVSWNGPLLIPAATRLQGIFFWDLLVYLLEGFVFLVTGLQARTLLDRRDAVQLRELGLAVLLTVAVVIAVRFIWVYPATYLPRWLSPSLARRDPSPPWQWVFLLAFVGVRGVVSLAAALAIPLTTAAGAAFPDRDLILFITFGLIVVTLVGQGLLLPIVVRWLGLAQHAADERERERKAELAARSDALSVAQNRLQQLAAGGHIAPEVLAILQARHDYRSGRLSSHTSDGLDAASTAADLRAELIAAEREYIHRSLQDGRITDEAPPHRARARPGGGKHRLQERRRSGASALAGPAMSWPPASNKQPVSGVEWLAGGRVVRRIGRRRTYAFAAARGHRPYEKGFAAAPRKEALPEYKPLTYDNHHMKRKPRSDRKEASRERILDAASRAVRRAGFDGVGVAEVMKEAGLTHGGFYAHFDSRDALLSAAVAYAGCSTANALQEHITRLTRAGVSPFRALLETYLYDGAIANCENGCAVAALCAETPRQSPDVVDAFLRLVHDLHRRVGQALPTGQPARTAWAVTSTLVGALQLARAIGNNDEGRAVLAATKRDLLARYEP